MPNNKHEPEAEQLFKESAEKFSKDILELVQKFGDPQPGWVYNKEGNIIQVYWEDVPMYAERLNKHLELYRAEDDNRVVGCILWGFSKSILND